MEGSLACFSVAALREEPQSDDRPTEMLLLVLRSLSHVNHIPQGLSHPLLVYGINMYETETVSCHTLHITVITGISIKSSEILAPSRCLVLASHDHLDRQNCNYQITRHSLSLLNIFALFTDLKSHKKQYS